MRTPDIEIESLKAGVSCATVLEQLPPTWTLDRTQSSRQNLKYRRGPTEILIVNHDGHGWWDPLSDNKGDIFSLVQHLDPGLTFAEACEVLRGLVGVMPTFPEMLREKRQAVPSVPVAERWGGATPLARGSPTWLYLTEQRGLPDFVLSAAHGADAIREGPQASAWFAHRDSAGDLTGIEMRGPDWRSFSAGGSKALFRFPGGVGRHNRVVVCEAAIDALSIAAIEQCPGGSLYTATAGGMGPATILALQSLLQELAADPSSVLVAATDADGAGRRHAERLGSMAAEAGVRFDMILPPDGLNDWNDALRARR